MFRCIKVKRSVSPMMYVLNCDIRRFHVTSKMCARKVRKSSVDPENLNHDLDPLLMTNNDPNVNFLGIESDVGVITVGSSQNKLPISTTRSNLKEQFHKTSFGIVRYDGDNKVMFHGQYKNKTVFPRVTEKGAQVSAELRKLPNRSSNHSETLLNNKEINKYCGSYSLEQDESYIDKHYFNNISETEISTCNNIHPSSEELNFIDKNYFETSTPSGNTESDSLKQDESYIDKYYFKNISETEDTNCNNNYIHPSKEELNFTDKNYFEPLTTSKNYISERANADYNNSQTPPELNPVHKSNFETVKDSENFMLEKEKSETSLERELLSKIDVSQSSVEELNYFEESYFKNSVPATEKSPSAQEVSGDIPVNPEINFYSRMGEVAKPDSSEKFHRSLKSNIIENQQITTKSSHILPESYATHNEPATDFASSIKNKREKFMFAEINHKEILNTNNEQELKQILSDDFENTNISSDMPKTDLLLRQKLGGNIASGVSENKLKQSNDEETDSISTAHDFVTKMRKEQEIPQQAIKKEKTSEDGEKFDSKGFRILKNQVQDLSYFTRDEIFNMLKQNIVYSDDDLLVLNKPYGLVIHDSQTTRDPCLSTFLNDLAKDLDRKSKDPQLFTIHRIDKETTGCLLLARNESMAQYLKSLFVQRKIIKKYWVITTRVPDPREGIINIPISEGSINNKKRMVLHPNLPKDIAYKSHSRHGKEAITSYSVISVSGNAALVEVLPKTGVKHQIRVHFGFGLSCPILGDHKYSHLDKLAPQKLPSDILQRLKVRQSKVRYIPMHIHAKSVTIPQYFDNRDLFVNIPLPSHMTKNLKSLKFKKK